MEAARLYWDHILISQGTENVINKQDEDMGNETRGDIFKNMKQVNVCIIASEIYRINNMRRKWEIIRSIMIVPTTNDIQPKMLVRYQKKIQETNQNTSISSIGIGSIPVLIITR